MKTRDADELKEIARRDRRSAAIHRYGAAAAVVAVGGVLAWISDRIGLTVANIAMLFVAGVALVAVRLGRGAAIMAAVLSVLVYDYFFVMPRFAFAISDLQYVVTLVVMVSIAVLVSELTSKLQSQLATSLEQERRLAELYQASQKQERRTSQLYQMTRELNQLAGTDLLVRKAAEQLGGIFGGDVLLFLRAADGELQLRYGGDAPAGNDRLNVSAAKWVCESMQSAGLGTRILDHASARLVPMSGAQQLIGVLGIRPGDSNRFDDEEEQRLLDACAGLVALTIHRDQLRAEAEQAHMQVQAEQLRNSLLSSVSHDLRTPLAMIAVTASSLLDESAGRDERSKQEMLQTVVDESNRLSRQVENFLDMARLDSGPLTLNCDWEVLEELVGVALNRLRGELADRTVQVDIPAGFPLVWVADDLFAQVLVNLLENAINYTPRTSRIDIGARSSEGFVEIMIGDNGPGLPSGSEARIFDKFFRGTKVADGQRGIGLGLTICRAIINAHRGQITAHNRTAGGAEFLITLPIRASADGHNKIGASEVLVES